MLTNSLFKVNRYFFGSFKVLKQGYIIPTAPSKPDTERIILQKLLRSEKSLRGKTLASTVSDKNAAVEERNKAKLLREQSLRDYEKKIAEYEKIYTFPKRSLTPFAIFLKEQFQTNKGVNVVEFTKKCGEAYKALSLADKEVYFKKAEEDKLRYQNETKSFEQRNSSWRIPPFHTISGYQLFIQDQFTANPKQKLGEISKKWNTVSEEQKKIYHEKSEKATALQKENLYKFQKEHNISEDVFKSLFKRKRTEKKEKKSE